MITEKLVTIYVCGDGTTFDSKESAEAYERKEALVAELEASDIYWRETSADEVATWLLKNYTITRRK